MKDIKKILELIKAEKQRFRKPTRAAQGQPQPTLPANRIAKRRQRAPQHRGIVGVTLKPYMGLTNMLYSLGALATYAKTYGMAIHWPNLNSTVTGKGPHLPMSQIFDVALMRGLGVEWSDRRPTQTKHGWSLVHWARRSNPGLYRSFLDRCRIAAPLRTRVATALAGVPKPFVVLHPRVEADWQANRVSVKRRFITAPEILTFVKTCQDQMEAVKAWVVIGDRNPAIQTLTESMSTLLKLPIYHALDLLHPLTHKTTYTHKSALAFQMALQAHKFIGCPGSTFSHEVCARLGKPKAMFYS